MNLPQHVLITGAAGNLGTKLHRHLRGRCALTLLDLNPGGDPDILAADLSRWDDTWVATFAGSEAVVHLAGNPVASDPWPELVGPNVDAVLNVFEAAARGGVRRVVFASSNHVMAGYHSEPGVRITPNLPPRPGMRYTTEGQARDSTAYGTTKLFGERVGRHYAEARGLEVIAVRIGWVWRGENTPAGLPADRGAWFRDMWLSDRDYLHLMECCLTAEPGAPFVVVNGMSANAGMAWDLSDTTRLLGYHPKDDVSRG
jgi:NAD+ dependent glucose-6-phosphate dehydrogenase